MTAISGLPKEDTIWRISVQQCDSDDSDETDSSESQLVVVTDTRNALIGAKSLSAGSHCQESVIQQVLEECMVQPLSGQPRCPTHVKAGDGCTVYDLDLSGFGITYIDPAGARPHPAAPVDQPMKTCLMCKRKGTLGLFHSCNACNAVYFCSDSCEQTAKEDQPPHRHPHWCSIMAAAVSLSGDLANLPFTYSPETTSESFTDKKYRSFLKRYGVHGRGLWQREATPDKTLPSYGELCDSDSYVLQEANLLTTPGTDSYSRPSTDLCDWKSYYEWRGFKMDSPIAVLLTWPLTVYQILKQYLSIHETPNPGGQTPVVIHLIGCEMEADIAFCFQELGALLPDHEFSISMIGPGISRKVNKKVKVMGKVTVTFLKGLYHKVEHGEPHIVIGLNAGLGAYSSWVETLTHLKTVSVPVVFTDFCWYSCQYSREPIEALQLGRITDPVINPFRSPIRRPCEDHALPWYSNAFIYRLIFSE